MALTTHETPTVCDCGHPPTPQEPGSCGTGYGYDNEGKTYCYDCCAKRDKAQMERDGKTTLYLVHQGNGRYEVSNWPGTLSFPVGQVRKGHHNIARTRYDFYFIGPEKAVWAGVQYGEWTQIAYCRRLKRQPSR